MKKSERYYSLVDRIVDDADNITDEEINVEFTAIETDAIVRRADNSESHDKWQFWSEDNSQFFGTETHIPLINAANLQGAINLVNYLGQDDLRFEYGYDGKNYHVSFIYFIEKERWNAHGQHRQLYRAILIAVFDLFGRIAEIEETWL